MTEIEADKFATYFLMPKKLLEKEFFSVYYSVFQIDENSAFKFGGRSTRDLKNECKDLRALSRKLATAESFDNRHFSSLTKIFKVSVEAMAIRLEELKLVN